MKSTGGKFLGIWIAVGASGSMIQQPAHGQLKNTKGQKPAPETGDPKTVGKQTGCRSACLVPKVRLRNILVRKALLRQSLLQGLGASRGGAWEAEPPGTGIPKLELGNERGRTQAHGGG